MTGRRVIVARPVDPRFKGMAGVVIEEDRRSTQIRVELDMRPIDCSSRCFWFDRSQVDEVRDLATGRAA